jgi:hypothetical protein
MEVTTEVGRDSRHRMEIEERVEMQFMGRTFQPPFNSSPCDLRHKEDIGKGAERELKGRSAKLPISGFPNL